MLTETVQPRCDVLCEGWAVADFYDGIQCQVAGRQDVSDIMIIVVVLVAVKMETDTHEIALKRRG